MSTNNSVVTTRALRKLFDAFKGEVELNGNTDLFEKIYVASTGQWIPSDKFRDTASRLDLLDFFSDHISDRGGSVRAAVPVELVVALFKVRGLNFKKLLNLVFIRAQAKALIEAQKQGYTVL